MIANLSNLLGSLVGTSGDQHRRKMNVLNSVELFENANRRDLQQISSFCEFESMSEGERIVEKGEVGVALYVIDEGRVSVRLEEDSSPVTRLREGDYFGEMALLENEPRSAYVDCEASGRLLKLSREGFQELLQRRHKVSAKFLFVVARTLSKRLRETNVRVSDCDD